jgi:hypothetical protein
MKATHDVSNDYGNFHSRLRRRLGRADAHLCTACGAPAQQWAYDHADPNEHIDARTGNVYSIDEAYYKPMCRTCHRVVDAGWATAHREYRRTLPVYADPRKPLIAGDPSVGSTPRARDLLEQVARHVNR